MYIPNSLASLPIQFVHDPSSCPSVNNYQPTKGIHVYRFAHA
jgi:hypothetical protein